MNKEKIIKEIEECFDDMRTACIEMNAANLVRLFREYTDEIIKIINKGE